MRWQSTAALAVVLIALAGFYYVYEVRLAPEREKAEARKGRIFTADPKDVVEISVKRAEDVLRLKREGDDWQIQEPIKARADRAIAEELATTFSMARSDREVVANPTSPADFGLDKPAVDVTLTLKDGKQLGLELGGKNPTGVWVYAREREKPGVLLVSDSVFRDATRPVADLRDKTVVSFNRGDVSGLEIATGQETLAVQRADGKWSLTSPRSLPADAELIGEFLDKLGGARVTAFVAESPPSLAPYGLDRPVRVAIHTGTDKDRATRSVNLGRLDAEKKGIYAMRPGEPSVLLVPQDVWQALPKNVAALRNKVVLEYDRDKVERVDIESPKGAVTLAREDTRWKITAPEALAADSAEVGAVLSSLRDLRALGFLTDDASGIPRYLAKPEVRVTLTQKDAPPTTLLLGPSPEARGGQPSAYAAVADRGPVVLVDAKALASLRRSALELRDRTVVAVEPKDVKRLRVKAGGQSMLLERSDADWRVVEPAKGAAKSARVDDILFMLRGLRWKEIAAPSSDDAARWGFDTPSLEVTLLKADGGEIATVVIGKREGEQAWVRTTAQPTVYAVDSKQLGDLPKLPDDLKG
jgi:Domain of unknown function (DUF4340)